MPLYAMLLRDDPAVFADVSAEEMDRIIQKYRAWRLSLGEKVKFGHKLVDGSGRVLRGTAVTDGPFAETKEVMAGLMLLEADSYEEALEIAKRCPHVEYGSIEVREIQVT